MDSIIIGKINIPIYDILPKKDKLYCLITDYSFLKMGNCETCENVDRKSSTNVILRDNLNEKT